MEEFKNYIAENWQTIVATVLTVIEYFLIFLYARKTSTTKTFLSTLFKEKASDVDNLARERVEEMKALIEKYSKEMDRVVVLACEEVNDAIAKSAAIDEKYQAEIQKVQAMQLNLATLERALKIITGEEVHINVGTDQNDNKTT